MLDKALVNASAATELGQTAGILPDWNASRAQFMRTVRAIHPLYLGTYEKESKRNCELLEQLYSELTPETMPFLLRSFFLINNQLGGLVNAGTAERRCMVVPEELLQGGILLQRVCLAPGRQADTPRTGTCRFFVEPMLSLIVRLRRMSHTELTFSESSGAADSSARQDDRDMTRTLGDLMPPFWNWSGPKKRPQQQQKPVVDLVSTAAPATAASRPQKKQKGKKAAVAQPAATPPPAAGAAPAVRIGNKRAAPEQEVTCAQVAAQLPEYRTVYSIAPELERAIKRREIKGGASRYEGWRTRAPTSEYIYPMRESVRRRRHICLDMRTFALLTQALQAALCHACHDALERGDRTGVVGTDHARLHAPSQVGSLGRQDLPPPAPDRLGRPPDGPRRRQALCAGPRRYAHAQL